MPVTVARLGLGIMPIGERVPLGVSRVTDPPTRTLRDAASASPSTMPGTSSTLLARSTRVPAVIDRPRSVTPPSSAGSMPLIVMNCEPASVVTRALSMMAGAAPDTPGTAFRRATSAS